MVGTEDGAEISEGVDSAELRSGGEGVAAKDYGILEAVDGEETTSGRIGADYEKLQGVGSDVNCRE
jgi:hypothetical protein